MPGNGYILERLSFPINPAFSFLSIIQLGLQNYQILIPDGRSAAAETMRTGRFDFKLLTFLTNIYRFYYLPIISLHRPTSLSPSICQNVSHIYLIHISYVNHIRQFDSFSCLVCQIKGLNSFFIANCSVLNFR